jgi:hypothetical protein
MHLAIGYNKLSIVATQSAKLDKQNSAPQSIHTIFANISGQGCQLVMQN